MASHRTSSGSPNIVWDKSRLHAEKPAMANGHAIVPSFHRPLTSGSVTPRPLSSGTVTPRPLSAGAVTPRPTSAKPGAAGAASRKVNGLIAVNKQLKVTPESELITSFDPLQDLHLWTMWRVAVNGRIVDETRRRNQATRGGRAEVESNPFGRALVKTPLDRFIRVADDSQDIADVMMDPHGEGGGGLGTQQFVFYGVPRVVLKKPKHDTEKP